jgi:hypothetical protein
MWGRAFQPAVAFPGDVKHTLTNAPFLIEKGAEEGNLAADER